MNQDFLAYSRAQVMPQAIATGLFVSLCTISEPTPAPGAISGTYTPVDGLGDIQCMDAPEPWGNRPGTTEQKTPAEVSSMAERHVLLDRYYSELSPTTNWGSIGWRATLTNIRSGRSAVYDIIGAEGSSQANETRMCLRKVTT